jgi:hypothetical protein
MHHTHILQAPHFLTVLYEAYICIRVPPLNVGLIVVFFQDFVEDDRCPFRNENRSSVKHLSRREVDPCAVERLWACEVSWLQAGWSAKRSQKLGKVQCYNTAEALLDTLTLEFSSIEIHVKWTNTKFYFFVLFGDKKILVFTILKKYLFSPSISSKKAASIFYPHRVMCTTKI